MAVPPAASHPGGATHSCVAICGDNIIDILYYIVSMYIGWCK
jgi:hypothetical protein